MYCFHRTMKSFVLWGTNHSVLLSPEISETFFEMRHYKYFQSSVIDTVQTLRKISFLVDIIFIILIFRVCTCVFHTVQYNKYTQNIIFLYCTSTYNFGKIINQYDSKFSLKKIHLNKFIISNNQNSTLQ